MFVKICGLTRPADALAAAEAGADAIGVVMCSDSPRSCTIAQARSIFEILPPGVLKVVVTHTESARDIEACLAAGPHMVQVSKEVPFPHPTDVGVIRVVGPGAPVPDDAAMLIVDGSHGTGRLFDLEDACRVVASSRVPVLLAGGLMPSNVGDAIRAVRPFGVDVASGVEERPGVKSLDAVRAFIDAARRVQASD
jgi:phosphoribosylanthranilate isomerase